MILESVFHTDEKNHEHVPQTAPGMPYVCIHTEMERFPEKRISWHWHSSLEFVYDVVKWRREENLPVSFLPARMYFSCFFTDITI